MLWCTHPGACHPVPAATYQTSQPKEWFVKVLPYLKTTVKLLKLTPIAEKAISGLDDEEIATQIEILDALCRATEDELSSTLTWPLRRSFWSITKVLLIGR
jgi:hypothetical protein